MTAIIAFSRTGCGTARRVAAILQEASLRGDDRANARSEGLSCKFVGIYRVGEWCYILSTA